MTWVMSKSRSAWCLISCSLNVYCIDSMQTILAKSEISITVTNLYRKEGHAASYLVADPKTGFLMMWMTFVLRKEEPNAA